MNGGIDKAKLFEDIGYEPHAGQLKVHLSPAPRRVLACGVRWGKSISAAMEAVAAALEPCDRSYGWIVGPNYDLANKVYREVPLVVFRHLRHRIKSIKESEKTLVLRNMAGGLSEVRAKSADNPVSLLGEGLDWVIVDEAARMKPTIWEGHLSQRLLDKRGWALLISTPKGKGWFYDVWRRGQEGRDEQFESWNYPSSNNPHLDAELIEAERARLPERVFAQEYGAEFCEGSGSVFRNVRDCATGEWQEPVPGKSYVAGVDLAKVEDFTVLVLMNQEYEVVFFDRFHRLDWSLQIGRIKAACERYNNAQALVDSTGAGEPVYENMCAEGLSVKPYQFTAKSKTALIDNLALKMEKQAIILPRAELWPEGIDELESFQFTVSDSGNVKSGAPSGIHDDTVMALALATWQVAHQTVDGYGQVFRRRRRWPQARPAPNWISF